MYITPSSFLSKRIFGEGFKHTFNDEDLTIQILAMISITYFYAKFTEILNSMCLSLDVIFTIKDSFNRAKNLNMIL